MMIVHSVPAGSDPAIASDVLPVTVAVVEGVFAVLVHVPPTEDPLRTTPEGGAWLKLNPGFA